jgi:hypothetical protein
MHRLHGTTRIRTPETTRFCRERPGTPQRASTSILSVTVTSRRQDCHVAFAQNVTISRSPSAELTGIDVVVDRLCGDAQCVGSLSNRHARVPLCYRMRVAYLARRWRLVHDASAKFVRVRALRPVGTSRVPSRHQLRAQPLKWHRSPGVEHSACGSGGEDGRTPQRAINTGMIAVWRHLRSKDPTLLNHLANAAGG